MVLYAFLEALSIVFGNFTLLLGLITSIYHSSRLCPASTRGPHAPVSRSHSQACVSHMSTHGKPFAAHVASCHLIRCLLPLLQVSLGGLLSSGHFELEHDLHALMRGIKDSLLSCCVAFLFFSFFGGGFFMLYCCS